MQEVSQCTGVSVDRVQQLFDTYGTRADLAAEYIAAGDDQPINNLPQYSRREIMWLTQTEMVSHLTDIVLRRSLIAWQGHLTLIALRDIADMVADTLDWPETQKQSEIEGVTAVLMKRHRMQLHDTKKPSLAAMPDQNRGGL